MRLPALTSLALVTLPIMSVLGCQMNSVSVADSGSTSSPIGAAITLAPVNLTFAGTPVGATATAQVLTLRNASNEALNLSGTEKGISITGANASSYAQTNECGTSLVAGASCAITVTFTPASAGPLNASVSVADNTSGYSQIVALSGTGTAPAVSISSPASLTFPITPVGAVSAAQSTTLYNTGDGALDLSGPGMGISITGANASSFVQTNQCGTSVAAGASCVITVTFNPAAAGALNASLSVLGNAGTSSQLISATGTGIDVGSGPPTGVGTVYYVDNTIPDVNVSSATPDCTTYDPATFLCGGGLGVAYATIADLNVKKFNPGDRILFRRGGIWREQLTDVGAGYGYSGSAGAPILFDSYGSSTSPLPTISGANLIANWVPEQISANGATVTVYSAQYILIPVPNSPASHIWTGRYADIPNQVFEDGTRLTQNTSNPGALTAGQWYLDTANSLIWLRMREDDNPDGHTIEASQRDYGIITNQNSNLSFYNLQVVDANVDGLSSIGMPGESANMVVYGIVSQNNYQFGIALASSTNDMIISSTAAYNGQDGIGGYQEPNFLITGNTTHDNGQVYQSTNNPIAGIHVDGPESANMIIENNLSYNNGPVGLADGTGGIEVDTVGSGVVIRYNRLYSNTKDGIEIDASNGVTAYANVIFGNGRYGIYAFADFQPNLTGTQIFNNTLYGNYGAGIHIQGQHGNPPNSCMNNSIINNIVVNTAVGPNIAALLGCENPGAGGTGNVYTFNDFGAESSNFIEWGTKQTNGAAVFYSSYDAWEAAAGNCGATGCSHSVEADPLFSNVSTNDFTPLANSPARGSGLNIGQPYNYGITTSSTWPSNVYLTNWSSSPGGWGIGAYSF